MTALRQSATTLRWVLACFLLTLGAAVAAPVAGLQSLELVCSAKTGMQLLVKGQDGEVASSHSTLDCPLCQPMGAPPSVLRGLDIAHPPGLGAQARATAARVAALTAPPLPARGPPSVAVLS